MTFEFEIERLSYNFIRKAASDFLSERNRDSEIPVQVEEIAEFDLNLNIIPVNRLKADFETDGFISSCFKNLYVDQDSFEKNPSRYRFTIAHEIGHLVLHKDIFQHCKFDSIAEWKSFVSEMNAEQRDWLEYQGYVFAGCLLVPEAPLRVSFERVLGAFKSRFEEAKEKNIDRETITEYLVERIAATIALEFDVSLETAKKRIKYDRLHELIV